MTIHWSVTLCNTDHWKPDGSSILWHKLTKNAIIGGVMGILGEPDPLSRKDFFYY